MVNVVDNAIIIKFNKIHFNSNGRYDINKVDIFLLDGIKANEKGIYRYGYTLT
ncbi:hypothetical protein UT300005_00670 [Clostridium sp. CTA-5]